MVFELTHEELRLTFKYQVQRLQEIDGKAIEILKANLLLIGIVVTGGSILIQTDLELGQFLNPFTVTGGMLLLASTGLAAVTYTASNLRGGIESEAVEAAIRNEDIDAFENQLLRSYAQWIQYNTRVTAVNDLLATVTVILVFVAFVYVVCGVVIAAAGLSSAQMVAIFVGVTLVMLVFVNAGVRMDHLGTLETPATGTFPGVPVSKGATRSEALEALKEMLRRR